MNKDCKVFACELFLLESNDIGLERVFDKTTGLNLFSIREEGAL